MKILQSTITSAILATCILSAETPASNAENLYTTEGADFSVEELVKSGAVEPGTWREWEGTYTMIKPHGAAIFQLFHSGGQLWAFHLGMSSEGDIRFNRRGKPPGLENEIVLAKNIVGKPLSIKIRSNGFEFEIFKKRPMDDKDWVPVTTGSYKKAEHNEIQFRWGMYSGQKKGASVPNDAMHFVSGVTIR